MDEPLIASKISRSTLQRYSETGYLGPVTVFDAPLCKSIVEHFGDDNRPAPAVWWKGHAVTDRFVFDVATRDEVLSPVKAILGANVVLWGAQYIQRAPGQEHAWHSDIETESSPNSFVSVWIGLVNTTRQSGLKFIAGSQVLGRSIQQVASEYGISRSRLSDVETLALARKYSSNVFIGQPTLHNGDAVFFAGGLWHMSLNTTKHTRAALLLQFVTPDVPVLIPDWTKLEWPFRMTDKRAPSLLVAGDAGNSPHDLRSIPHLASS